MRQLVQTLTAMHVLFGPQAPEETDATRSRARQLVAQDGARARDRRARRDQRQIARVIIDDELAPGPGEGHFVPSREGVDERRGRVVWHQAHAELEEWILCWRRRDRVRALHDAAVCRASMEQDVLAGTVAKFLAVGHLQAHTLDTGCDEYSIHDHRVPGRAHASSSTGGSGPTPPPAHENDLTARLSGSVTS